MALKEDAGRTAMVALKRGLRGRQVPKSAEGTVAALSGVGASEAGQSILRGVTRQ